jgi:spore coat polysaccharide biosynthesis protein SpsF (cytidylyltransferase family)
MNIPLIVQARVQSTRFPGKVLQPFAGGLTLLEYQLARLKAAIPSSPIVIATSTNAADEPIARAAEKMGVLCFRGDEQDVLGRFVACCGHFEFTGPIIRICGDNPFLQTGLLTILLNEAAGYKEDYDYIGFSVDKIPAIRTHFGFFGELVTAEALAYTYEHTECSHFHEHVTSYIYESTGSFRVLWLEIEGLAPYLNTLRLTVDSKEDFENALYVHRHLPCPEGSTGPSWQEIVLFIEGKPALKNSMARQINIYQK